jgi:hypothetical protein
MGRRSRFRPTWPSPRGDEGHGLSSLTQGSSIDLCVIVGATLVSACGASVSSTDSTGDADPQSDAPQVVVVGDTFSCVLTGKGSRPDDRLP